ncbi:hypothetical protein ACKTEK_03655 [Tepidamorphus sp. 3E244]|uniref:hypothetical protein n=1 Tax=Tepidamorphus sp. 3E244 TaxID=3385498 RepID=UPI0038FCE706
MTGSEMQDNDQRFETLLGHALAPEPAPGYLRAQIMSRVSGEAEAGPAALLRPRFSLPAAAFAAVCLFGGYTAGAQMFDATDDVASDMASAMGYIDTGVVTEDLL